MSDQKITSEAARWFAELKDECFSNEQWSRFEDWLFERPEHLSAFEAIQRTWEQAAALRILQRVNVSVRKSPFRRTGMILTFCASITVSIMVLLIIYWKPSDVRVVSAGIGERRHLVLEDGTQVDLNTATEIEVTFGGTIREIKLVRGEALFNVVHDARRPFVVRFGNRMAWDLGTRFSVRLRDARDADVLVEEGHVGVGCNPAPADVRAGAANLCALDIRAGSGANLRSGVWTLTEMHAADIERQWAWRRGYLEFREESLREVVAEINRYSSRQIEIADPSLAAVRIGARIKVTDIDAFLNNLPFSSGINAQASTDSNVIWLVRAPENHP